MVRTVMVRLVKVSVGVLVTAFILVPGWVRFVDVLGLVEDFEVFDQFKIVEVSVLVGVWREVEVSVEVVEEVLAVLGVLGVV